MKKIAIGVVLLAVLCAVGYWQWRIRTGSRTTFNLVEVKRGRLEATVGSTGTLQPREVVDVGAQVLGRIIFIGKDPNTKSGIVDWGSMVVGPVVSADGKTIKQGTVLAQIDPSLYEAQRNSAQASLKAAKADVLVKTATLNLATRDWGRAEKLFATPADGTASAPQASDNKGTVPPKAISQAEYDQLKAAYEAAKANLEVSKANVGLAEANLKNAQTNLDYTTITAPVSGVVIDRRVNVGQTVVASLSAPSLFLIAKDLSQMEVWATVNEVDVGKIRAGQEVRFTVDAFAGRTYKGTVVPQGKLPFRLNATMNQNVVTYTVVVSVDNKDGKLRPYLTANLTFVVADKKDVLVVPNAALRWQPAREQIAPSLRDEYLRRRGKKSTPAEPETSRGFVWVPDEDGYVRYIEVRTGLSDSVNTELLGTTDGGKLPEGTEVIVGEAVAGARNGGANPFVAQPFGKKKE
jgi:HlyD family secretion protein